MLPIYQSGQIYQTAKNIFNDNSHSGLWFDKFYNYLIYKENGCYVDLDDANNLLCDEKDSDKKRLFSEFEKDENKSDERKENKILNYAHKKSKKDFFEGFKDGRGTTYCGNSSDLKNYAERLANLCHAQQGKTAIYQNDWLMAIGLGNSHPLENGLLWHPTLGVPYFQGSTVKGLAKALMEKWGAEPELIKRWFGSVNATSSKTADFVAMFDMPLTEELKKQLDEQSIGAFIFLDAVPVEPVMLKQSIMTPHYGDWYQKGDSTPTDKKAQPGDWHSPVPVGFLAVEKAKVQFGVMPRLGANVSDDEIEQINNVIRMALEHLGIGAKTATGYGRMHIDEQASKLQQAMVGLSANQQLIFKFKTVLDNLGKSWHNRANQPPKIKVDDDQVYDFVELFKLVETWADDEQKYALETLFLPYLPKLLGESISKHKKWKERINPLKVKLGVE